MTSYAYDFRNRMTGVTIRASAGGAILHQATYTYDSRDRRIGVELDGARTWTVYDGVNTYADFDGSGTLATRYLQGPAIDALLARTSSAGVTAWYLTDRLGSVRDLANTSGTVIDHVSYDAFGNILGESNPSAGDRFKYTAREFDPTTGLQSNRARYFHAPTGRWTQLDPIGFEGRDANLYRYVENAPSSATDPLGLYDIRKEYGGNRTEYEKAVREYSELYEIWLSTMDDIHQLEQRTRIKDAYDTTEARLKAIKNAVRASSTLDARDGMYRQIFQDIIQERARLESIMKSSKPRATSPIHIEPSYPKLPWKYDPNNRPAWLPRESCWDDPTTNAKHRL